MSNSRSIRPLVPVWAVGFALISWRAAAEPPQPAQRASPPVAKFELRDGDRVVLLGNTLIERDQSHGFLETTLTERFHRHLQRLIFRNLGWSGDTVWGDARGLFDKQPAGYQNLMASVTAASPTVIFVGYGTNESFAGQPGLARFDEGLNRLLDDLDKTHARIVLLSPLREEDLGRPLPDPKEQNRRLRLYRDAIEKIAARRGYPFVDLFERLIPKAKPKERPLTDDEMHLTERGYFHFAEAIESALLGPSNDWKLLIDLTAGNVDASGLKAAPLVKKDGGSWKLELTDDRLPLPFPVSAPGAEYRFGSGRVVQVKGLPAGKYQLSIDGQSAAEGTADQWAVGITIRRGPSFDEAEKLRRLIDRKNQLFFERWRPQNVTYLFLFRAHEQGQNAVEIPKFDPLVEDAERQIAAAAAPKKQTYEMTPVK